MAEESNEGKLAGIKKPFVFCFRPPPVRVAVFVIMNKKETEFSSYCVAEQGLKPGKRRVKILIIGIEIYTSVQKSKKGE